MLEQGRQGKPASDALVIIGELVLTIVAIHKKIKGLGY